LFGGSVVEEEDLEELVAAVVLARLGGLTADNCLSTRSLACFRLASEMTGEIKDVE
jgi:hypothetical protein